MMKHVSQGVYKRDSIMFYFDRGKKVASKILMDKLIFCNKCQFERINNRAEGGFVRMECGDCEFFFFCLFFFFSS